MRLSAKLLPYYTYEDYLHWKGKWEVIERIPYAMRPSPSPRHQAIAGSIHSIFLETINAMQCNCPVYQPIDLKLTDNTVLNPDFTYCL